MAAAGSSSTGLRRNVTTALVRGAAMPPAAALPGFRRHITATLVGGATPPAAAARAAACDRRGALLRRIGERDAGMSRGTANARLLGTAAAPPAVWPGALRRHRWGWQVRRELDGRQKEGGRLSVSWAASVGQERGTSMWTRQQGWTQERKTRDQGRKSKAAASGKAGPLTPRPSLPAPHSPPLTHPPPLTPCPSLPAPPTCAAS